MKSTIKISLAIILIMTFASIVKPVSAATTPADHLQNEANKLENAPTKAALRQTAELTKMQQRGDMMISNRITSLQNLITRITNDTRLSSSDKTAFIADINTTISNLQALKTKLAADTDVTTARADVKSIVTSFKVFAIYEPKTRLSVAVDNLLTITTNLQAQVVQIQTLINSLKAQGKDTTAMQNTLTDISAKLTDATTVLTNDKTTLVGLSVTSTNYTTVIQGVKTDLTHVHTDFTTVRTDFHSLMTQLRLLFKTVSPTAAPTK